MADRIQMRRDTAVNWANYNPILLEGELGIVLDDPNQYKMGDGIHNWNDLPIRGFDGTIVQQEGQSTTAVMSQKAVTDSIRDSFKQINESETTKTLQPHKLYVFGVVSSLTLTFEQVGNAVQEYMFQFTCPSNVGTTLNLPSGIRWVNNETPEPEPGCTYEVSVINGLGVCVEWEQEVQQ